MESIEQSAEVTCSVEVKEEYPGVENDEMSESYQDGCESLRSVKTGDNPITEQFTNTKHEPVDDINYKSSDADTIDIDTCIFKEEITRVSSEIENSEKNEISRHQQSVHEGKRYPCPHCDYEGTQKSSLIRHQKSVHEGKRYPCPHCDYEGTRKSSLITHQKSVHEGKRYPCPHCEYEGTRKSSLNKHQKSVHEGKI